MKVKLSDILIQCIFLKESMELEEVLSFLLDPLLEFFTSKKDDVLKQLIKREYTRSTAVGGRIALPHVRLDTMVQTKASLGICKKGLKCFDSPSKEPVQLVLLLLSPQKQTSEYLKYLAKSVMVLSELQKNLKSIEKPKDALDFIRRIEN